MTIVARLRRAGREAALRAVGRAALRAVGNNPTRRSRAYRAKRGLYRAQRGPVSYRAKRGLSPYRAKRGLLRPALFEQRPLDVLGAEQRQVQRVVVLDAVQLMVDEERERERRPAGQHAGMGVLALRAAQPPQDWRRPASSAHSSGVQQRRSRPRRVRRLSASDTVGGGAVQHRGDEVFDLPREQQLPSRATSIGPPLAEAFEHQLSRSARA